jgi:PAS domain S-box-containing protein
MRLALPRIPLPARISTRIGIVIAAIAGVCMVGMGIALTHSLNEMLVEGAAEELENAAVMQQFSVSQMFTGVEETLDFLSVLRSTRQVLQAIRSAGRGDRSSVAAAARLAEESYAELLLAKPDFLAVHFVSAQQGGREILRVRRNPAGIRNIRADSLARRMALPTFGAPRPKAGGQYYMEVGPGPGGSAAGSSLVLSAWVPLYDGPALAGALAVEVDLRADLARIFAAVPVAWVYAVSDEQGRVFFSSESFPRRPAPGQEPLRLTEVYPQIAGLYAERGDGEMQAARLEHHSPQDILALRRVPLEPASQGRALIVLLGAGYKGAMAAAREMHVQAIVLSVGSVLAVALVAGFAARYFLLPLRQIVAGVRRFGEGDTDPPLPIESRDELGVVARALHGMIRDVTAKARELQDSERQIRNILAAAQEGIWMLDAQGCTTWCNPPLARMLATTSEALAGASLYAYIHPEWQAAARSVIGRVQASGGERWDCRLVTAAGGDLWCELSAAPLPASQDSRGGVLVMVWDLTARRTAELELERGARMRELILSAAGDGIFGFDAGLRFTFVNPAASDMLGYSDTALLGQPLHTVHPVAGNGGPAEDCPLCAQARSGREAQGVHPFRHRDGHTFPAEFVSRPLAQGQMAGGVVVFKDVTVREHLQRMKEEFVATVSHELRTPMTSVLGSLKLVLDGNAGEVSADGRELLTIALDNGERLVRIVNDILDVERFESGGMELAVAPLRIADVLKRSLEAMRPLAQQAEVKLELSSVPPDDWVRGDADRLVQVVTNLISNAVKFSPNGGTVSVSARRAGASVRVLVADQGPGIPQEFRDRIFQKFAQAAGARQQSKGSTGLGLSICKAIVERHGGTIGYESTTGKGATFTFDLPAVPEPQSMPGPQAEAASQRSPSAASPTGRVTDKA